MDTRRLGTQAFWVPGHPKTKGSLEHIGGGKMRESVRGSKTWRKLVASVARREVLARGVTGRFGVEVVSWLQAPARLDLEQAREWILGSFSGDSDKLLRNVLDALGSESPDDAGVFANDGQAWDTHSHKRLVMPGMLAGQRVQLWTVPDDAPWS